MQAWLVYLKAAWIRFRGLISRGLSWVDYALSRFRTPSQIVSVWPEAGMALGPRIAIFVHFDSAGAVGAHVLLYVAALQEAGFSVVFVTNAGKLREDAMAALKPLCAGIVIRRNIGYDFGAMREWLEFLKLPRPDTEMVALVNDSIYGPFGPLDGIVERIDLEAADVWGLTESWQRRYHLQSFFIAVGPRALQSAAWADFWKDVRPVKSKTWVVNRYEVGLSQSLVRGGLRLAAIWPYESLIGDVNPSWLMEERKDLPRSGEPMPRMRYVHAHRIRHNAAARRPLNPTSDLWRQLLRAGFPFIKRELLRDNPTEIVDLLDWRDEVRAKFGAVPDAIERDLRRVMRNRVG